MLRRFFPLLLVALLGVPSRALAQQAVSDWPRMDSSALNPQGGESLLLDVAVMPQAYYRLDALGNATADERLAAWANLSSRSFADGRVRVVLSFRYDLDGGLTLQSTSSGLLLQPSSYALLAAYLEYDATNWLHFRIGRQFFADLADYLAFDGARAMLKLPIPIQLEVYGGIRSSLNFTEGTVSSGASSLYELDGVPQVSDPQPVVGAAIRWVGNLQAREEASIGFRESWTVPTSSEVSNFGLQSTPGPYVTAQELVASAARDVGPIYLSAGVAYEIALARIMRAKASLVVPFARFVPIEFMGGKRQLDLSLDYQRFQPTFALDSIWNYFTMFPFDEGSVGLVLHGGDLRLEGHAFVRVFNGTAYPGNSTTPVSLSPGTEPAAGGRVSAAWGWHGELIDGGVSFQNGFGGEELLIDTGIRHRFAFPLELYGRLSVSNWSENEITNNAGSSFGAIFGTTYRFPYGASASLILEETVGVPASVAFPTPTTTIFSSAVPRVFAVIDLTRWL